MGNSVFELYRSQTYDLAQSLVIKYDDEAKRNNALIKASGGVIEDDPTQWRYYLNLYGKYHRSNTIMRVVSLDTQEEIELNKEVLITHVRTRLALQPGKPLYNSLLDKYPHQAVLLKGLTLPVDPYVAAKAKNGTILNYRKDLVEPNEHHLIDRLQQEVYGIFTRWHIDTHFDYGAVQSAAWLIPFVKALPELIFTLRESVTHSNQTHSYHVWRYLASRGRLDRYRRYLSNKQALWLYRELKYLLNFAGQTHTLEALIEHLLTPNGIKAFELSYLQSTEKGANPELSLKRSPINYKQSYTGDIENVTLLETNQYLTEEVKYSVNDPADDTERLETLTSGMLSTVRPSKAIETLIPESVSLVSEMMVSHLLRQWSYHALSDNYLADVVIKEQRTGRTFKLNVKDAYYLYMTLIAWHQDRKPDFSYFGVPGAITTHVPDYGSLQNNLDRVHPDHLFALLDAVKVTTPLTSVDDFYRQSHRQFEAMLNFERHGEQQMHSYQEAEYYSVLEMLKRNALFTIPNEVGTESWVAKINETILDYSKFEIKAMVVDILSGAIGLDRGVGKSAIRDRLTELIREITTYHISFVPNQIADTVYPLRATMYKPTNVVRKRERTRMLIHHDYTFKGEHTHTVDDVIRTNPDVKTYTDRYSTHHGTFNPHLILEGESHRREELLHYHIAPTLTVVDYEQE